MSSNHGHIYQKKRIGQGHSLLGWALVHGSGLRHMMRNWAEYEAGLRRRGDLTVWLSNDALDAWLAPPSGKPSGQRTYADIAIEAALTIGMVFRLPLRQTESFLRSLADLLEVDLPIPDHTTLSRRLQELSEIRWRPSLPMVPTMRQPSTR